MLTGEPGGRFDAVYCSHVLEHFYDHDLPVVLRGIRHVLKPEGWAEIMVPDVGQAMKTMAEGRDLDFILYHSPTGPISIADMLWGSRLYHRYDTGNAFMVHKNGFTRRTLGIAMNLAGFWQLAIEERRWELRVLGFLQEPSAETKQLLGVENGE